MKLLHFRADVRVRLKRYAAIHAALAKECGRDLDKQERKRVKSATFRKTGT